MFKIPDINDFNRTFDDRVWTSVAATILERHEVRFSDLQRAEQGENIVFLVDQKFVLKIYTPQKNGYKRERRALEFAEGRTSIPIPSMVDEGEIAGYNYLITTRLPGEHMSRQRWLKLDSGVQIGLLTQLASGLKQLHKHDPKDYQFNWPQFFAIQVDSAVIKQVKQGGNPEWIRSMPAYLAENLPLIPSETIDAFQHGDVHFGNMQVIEKNGKLEISGLFDFADSLKGFHEYEFIAIGVLMTQGQGELQREFFRAYGYPDNEIDETLRRRMMTLTMLYEYSSLRRYAERLRPEAVTYSLEKLEREIWSFA